MDSGTSGMRSGWTVTLLGVGWLTASMVGLAGTPALAQIDVYNDAFTAVSVQGDVAGSVGPNLRRTKDGSTAHSWSYTAIEPTFTPGFLYGDGLASFGRLQARVEIAGPSAWRGTTRASFSDVYAPSGGVSGTEGVFYLVYSLTGFARVEYNDNPDPIVTIENVARATIAAQKIRLGEPTEELGSESATVPYSYSNDGNPVMVPFAPSLRSVQVPFIYGEKFTLTQSLVVDGYMDNGFLRSTGPPTRYFYGGGSIDSVLVDYFHTAELIAVVNEENPEFVLTGVSPLDYQALVTDTFPVPEPGPWAAALVAVAGVGWFRMRRGACGLGT
jgi:hypothetical protein